MYPELHQTQDSMKMHKQTVMVKNNHYKLKFYQENDKLFFDLNNLFLFLYLYIFKRIQ